MDFNRRGKPADNATVESFNGKFREECLNAHWFESIEDAKQKIDAWRWDYDEHRPHRSLEGLTPREFAAKPVAYGSQTRSLRGPNFPGRSKTHCPKVSTGPKIDQQVSATRILLRLPGWYAGAEWGGVNREFGHLLKMRPSAAKGVPAFRTETVSCI
jgi:hypothetical protein